jgi:hypothetical protein
LLANQHLNWDGTDWINADNDRTEMRVRNGTASPMSRGDVIAIESAHNQNLVNVILADASQTSAMPALGILAQDLAVGEEGIAITFGKAGGLNTSGFTEGTTVYVSPTTPGQVVNAKPSGVNELIQNVGIVMRSHPSNGVIKVTGIGRSNDIDNQTRSDLRFLNGPTLMPASNSSFSAMPEWVEGSGSQGSEWIASFSPPNTDLESIREYRSDPFYGSSIVWVARDVDTGTGYDGGFGSSAVPIDSSYTYRISGFVKQHTPTSGTNYFSFGPGSNFTSDPTKALKGISSGNLDTNPRFRSFHSMPTFNEWYLVVGHVQASSTSIPGVKLDDAGVWDLDGNLIATSYNDYVFSSTATQLGLRFEQFNNPNGTNDEVEFFSPRIDKLDGNEPSIDDLLKRFHNRVPEVVPSITEGGSAVTHLLPCPHPQPFWYGQTTADSTASRSYDWGSAATETEVVCSDHFNWDATNSRLYVSSTGVYEVDVMFMIDGGSDFTANVIVKVDGTAKNTLIHDYVSANSPSEYSGRWVGKVDAGSYITATFQDAAVVVSTSHEAGSTMIVKRLA